jgi:peptidoglycan/xylan/chitin deacetylase (PgdA/CDA1 family)
MSHTRANHIDFNLFAGGRPKALTFSYDDGVEQDKRLVEILNKHDLKGTFHINSGTLGNKECMHPRINADEVQEVYQGHEVSLHSVTHPFLDYVPRMSVINQILDDRKDLEDMVGYLVQGLSYPYGTYNSEVIAILKELGVTYARTVLSTKQFSLPDDFLLWNPTCHHRDALEMGDQFKMINTKQRRPILFYVWGHSYEFDTANNWDMIEEFCASVAHDSQVWYATNSEIFEYVTALKRLCFSANCDIVYNPNALTLWFSVNGDSVEVQPGETKRL